MKELLRIDWNDVGRRVMVDITRGIISWMSPSPVHEGLATAADAIVGIAGERQGDQVVFMRNTRWKSPDDPKGTGLEADTAFYIGAKVDAWTQAANGSDQDLVDYEKTTSPDLVVEVDMTHLDEGKPQRYAALDIREMWRVAKGRGDSALSVDILDLQARDGPRPCFPICPERSLPNCSGSRDGHPRHTCGSV